MSNRVPKSVDYKVLLWKYIHHVGHTCGDGPINPRKPAGDGSVPILFRKEELEAFDELSKSFQPPGDW